MTLFFDLDGPILDVRDRYYRAYAFALKKLRARALLKKEYWELKRKKIPDYDILDKTSSGYLLDKFKARRNLLIEKKDLLKLDSVWPTLRKVYQRLFKKIPTVLVTLRTYPRRVFWQLKTLNIDSWFKLILSHRAEDSLRQRWQAKINLINSSGILKGTNPKDCLFVGDTETDIITGKKLGMKTVAVSFGIRSGDLLSPLNPDFLFSTPSELADYLKEL